MQSLILQNNFFVVDEKAVKLLNEYKQLIQAYMSGKRRPPEEAIESELQEAKNALVNEVMNQFYHEPEDVDIDALLYSLQNDQYFYWDWREKVNGMIDEGELPGMEKLPRWEDREDRETTAFVEAG